MCVCLCLTFHQQLRLYGDGLQLKDLSDRLQKLGIELLTLGLQGKLTSLVEYQETDQGLSFCQLKGSAEF